MVEIIVSGTDHAMSILPDNGRVFVSVESNEDKIDELKVSFSGIGGGFTAIYHKRIGIYTS